MSRFALLLLLVWVQACEWPLLAGIPWAWRTYEHPTYRFSLRVPRAWDVEPAGVMGAQVVFLASEKDPAFRANANLVVQKRPEKRTLKEEAGLSLRQIALMLNEYELLSEAPTQLGNLPAHELRGRYRAAEGSRIIRTRIAFTEDMEYVFTFTCREEREIAFQPVVKEMIRFFRAPGSLSGQR